ncbi:hypothetical protein [Streptomyces sp. TE33382]
MSLPYESPDDAHGTVPRRAGGSRAGGSRAGRTARSAVTAVLITLGCLLVPVSLLTVWVHDIVLDSDRYVSTVAPLATDPAIEEAAVRRITEAADVRVDGGPG